MPITPLTSAGRLGVDLDLELWMKDESRGATYSHKDRLAAVAAAHALATQADVVVVSSSGNHGAAIAAACTRLSVQSVCLTIPEIAPPLRGLIEGSGGRLVALPRAELRWTLMDMAVAELGWYPASNFSNPPIGSNPYAIDGYKAIAWEIVQQLGSPPDWVVCPTGYGDLLYGMHKGFSEIQLADPSHQAPRMLAACTSTSLPDALRAGVDQPGYGRNHAPEAVSISVPTSTHQALTSVRRSDGAAQPVHTHEIQAARRTLSTHLGAFQELSSAASLAAVVAARRSGVIAPGQRVVFVATSTGLKDMPAPEATQHLLPIEPTLESLRRALSGSDP
jgi:threonine synthase